jgi:hypothetical protein
MMNRNAQILGNFLPSFPVILAIIAIMGVFIFLSLSMAATKSYSTPQLMGAGSGKDLMLEKVNVNGQEKLVLDIVVDCLKSGECADFRKSNPAALKVLKSFVNGENSLLAVYIGTSEAEAAGNYPMAYFNYNWNNGAVDDNTIYLAGASNWRKYPPFKDYIANGQARQLSFVVGAGANAVRYYVYYYYGPCIKNNNGRCV